MPASLEPQTPASAASAPNVEYDAFISYSSGDARVAGRRSLRAHHRRAARSPTRASVPGTGRGEAPGRACPARDLPACSSRVPQLLRGEERRPAFERKSKPHCLSLRLAPEGFLLHSRADGGLRGFPRVPQAPAGQNRHSRTRFVTTNIGEECVPRSSPTTPGGSDDPSSRGPRVRAHVESGDAPRPGDRADGQRAVRRRL